MCTLVALEIKPQSLINNEEDAAERILFILLSYNLLMILFLISTHLMTVSGKEEEDHILSQLLGGFTM
jgi:hypothetical protein